MHLRINNCIRELPSCLKKILRTCWQWYVICDITMIIKHPSGHMWPIIIWSLLFPPCSNWLLGIGICPICKCHTRTITIQRTEDLRASKALPPQCTNHLFPWTDFHIVRKESTHCSRVIERTASKPGGFFYAHLGEFDPL